MKKSIFFKIFGGYLFLTTALCGLVIASSFYIIRASHMDGTSRDLTDLALALKPELTHYVRTKDMNGLDLFTKKIGGTIHTRITVVAPDGVVLADSEQYPQKMDNHRTRTEVAQALEGKTGRFLRTSDTLKQEMLYIAIPVAENNKVLYVLRVSRFLKDIRTTTNRLIERIVIVTLLIDIMALIFAFMFSRGVSRPVRELNNAFHRAADGHLNVRLLFRRRDEFAELGDSFNDMIAGMEDLFSEISRQKEELDSIISSLREGILVLDKEERVLVTNASMREIMAKDLNEGTFYWETLREPKLSELVRKVRTGRSSSTGEIEINNRVFLCSATFLSQREEITIVFHDITEMRRLERIKTDFVLNVSHELRTPLTSIKGFVETIEAGSLSDDNCHYMEVIKRNTDRLINIVSDLLTLSELQEKGSTLHLESVDLVKTVEGVFKIFEQQVKTKGVSLELIADADLPFIQGDPFKLEQVFTNLIDNALKYTENGGITVTMKGQNGLVLISIQDTGSGIPSEHLPRVFERFYVVDKSRSKKLGGTGLGLSIVKHIVLLHGGTISVASTPGKGSIFTIELPAGGAEVERS